MDFQEEFGKLHADNEEMKEMMLQLLVLRQEQNRNTGTLICTACSQHQLLPHLQPHLLPLPHNPTMLCGPLQPLHASAAPCQRKLLAPIPPASPHHQLQRSARATLRPMSAQQKERQTNKELLQEVLELAEEIKLASLNDTKAWDQTGYSVGSLRSVDRRTPSALRTLPFLNSPIAPAIPAPPKTTSHSQFQSRLPRLKKTISVNVVTAVTEQKSVESLTGKQEETREQKEVKKRKVNEARHTNKTQLAKNLPELAKLRPLSCPEQALLQAFTVLSDDDWEKKIEALISIRSLAQHHAKVLLPRLHDVCLAVNQEVKNLHSVVSRAAMVTLAHLFAHLGQDMDAEAEGAARTLLPKAGESSSFMKDMDLALGYMVYNTNPIRSMNALINGGLSHKHTAVRKSTARHLEKVTEVMGAARLLSGKKDLTARFIHAASCLALDNTLEVRNQARSILSIVASHPDLIKMVERFAPLSDQIRMKDFINKCQKRPLR
ncbi:TOG array regulator of axonemal microtubules protein 1-like [Alosa sapidissima]|uniref:TOG array regulator of axonemal microtubules protein 1-like n=1 Tax=Alosa sapidissima TaxID=34773 RepID=UPI001C0988DB|nr:TOG array regulator of axonemal microtubules protein 1-like [Alosa sapidissima]